MCKGMDARKYIQMSDDCSVGAGRLTSMAKFGVTDRRIDRQMDPSVGRFKTGKAWRFVLDKNGPPVGIKTEDIVTKSIAPECNHGSFAKVKVPTLLTSLHQLPCGAYLEAKGG